MKRSFAAGIALAAMLVLSQGADAITLDLTSEGAFGSINGAYFEQVGPQPTGTGYIDSFVEIISNADVVEAYNTTVDNVLDNGSSDQFNHALLLSEIPVVFFASNAGQTYYQFLLDINQTGGASDLSLDEIQIFQSNTPNQSVETFSGGGLLQLADATLAYRLDAGADNWIWLDYSLNTGSGSGDMFAYIPTSLFTGAGQYVYLYSRFGENFVANDGFEEWAIIAGQECVIPEPASLALLGIGLAGVLVAKRRRV